MKSKFPRFDSRRSALLAALVAGVLAFGVVVLFAVLVSSIDEGDGRSSGSCPGRVVDGINPATCLPYGSGGTTAPATNHSGSSGQKAATRPPNAPAVKVPATSAAKAPVPAAPPVKTTK
ncbi:hypothetical protein ACFWCA_19235 [Streptomyces phaeochromogenes]|uniref:hypothetical protein n=1 Tax=Streptomyces phaeochromogenes TaxID=1923 RepID=UPI00369EB571